MLIHRTCEYMEFKPFDEYDNLHILNMSNCPKALEVCTIPVWNDDSNSVSSSTILWMPSAVYHIWIVQFDLLESWHRVCHIYWTTCRGKVYAIIN